MEAKAYNKSKYWKALAVVLLMFSVVAGLLGPVPRLHILNETIRNLYFHVPMWFAMVLVLGTSAYHSIKFLRNADPLADYKAEANAKTGIFFGILGLLTGMVWAKFAWGSYWSSDPKQNASAIGLLIYLALFVLRGSFTDAQQRAQVSAIYNIFAYVSFLVLIFVLPRMTDSLHPGNGGNPGFNSYDLNSQMRWVFYPAVIGWWLVGAWLAQLQWRLTLVAEKQADLTAAPWAETHSFTPELTHA
jgi:heme exporter protein C